MTEISTPERIIAERIAWSKRTETITFPDDRKKAREILSALTAAGYPVEALPQMREALERLMNAGTGTVEMMEAHAEARAALAKQEQP